MRFLITFLVLSVHLFSHDTINGDRRPYYPYVTGDGFRHFANHTFDEKKKSLNPSSIKDGDVIFVKGDMLKAFFLRYGKEITSRYIVLSHNSDENIDATYQECLDTPNLIVCFAQNVCFQHPKLKPIPIGLQNRYVGQGGDCSYVAIARKQVVGKEQEPVVYVNFANHFGRDVILRSLRKLTNVQFASRTAYLPFLRALGLVRFVASPPGHGFDCHRHWEALYMGSIPIIQSGPMDPIFEGLPVILVQDWSEVTEDFLEQQYREIRSKNYSMEKLSAYYWFNLINSYKHL